MATKASAANLDFSNVKDGGAFNTKQIEAGDYLAKITKVEDAPVKSGDNAGRAQYLFTLKLVDLPSSVFPYYCQLTENQLWKLRNILVAAGKSVPKRKQKVDPNQIVGKLIGVNIEDDEYEGKPRSTVNGVFPAADLPDAPQDDSGPADDEDEPIEDEVEEEVETEEEVEEEVEEEADEEEEGDPYIGLSRAELKAEIKKFQPDFQAKKSQSDEDLRELLVGLAAAAPAAADDEEEDDEEEEAPAPKRTKAAATKKTRAKKAPVKVDDDEDLDELDIDNL